MKSENVKTEMIPVLKNAAGVNFLKVVLFYDRGGYNVFNYKMDPRGYYVSVTPIERADHDGYITESYTWGTGVKDLVKEVARKSEKAAREAAEAWGTAKKRCIEYVCAKQRLTVAE